MTQDKDSFHAWRRSIWSKGIAVCFILLVIVGNFWFVMAFESLVPPVWLQITFLSILGALLFFSLGLLLRQLILTFGRRDDNDPSV